MDLAVLHGEYEILKSNNLNLEKNICELKLKLAAARSALDDAEFAKKHLQKHIMTTPGNNNNNNTNNTTTNTPILPTTVNNLPIKSPSIRSFSSFTAGFL